MFIAKGGLSSVCSTTRDLTEMLLPDRRAEELILYEETGQMGDRRWGREAIRYIPLPSAFMDGTWGQFSVQLVWRC